MDPGSDDSDPSLTLLVAELAERLRPVCSHWDEPSFQALVHRMARLKRRWDDA
jgi:hypothetical protein